jgi:hypothetical protein
MSRSFSLEKMGCQVRKKPDGEINLGSSPSVKKIHGFILAPSMYWTYLEITKNHTKNMAFFGGFV